MWQNHVSVGLPEDHSWSVSSTIHIEGADGLREFLKRELARDRSPRSMKFPMALELMRAVVSTVCCPTSSLIGKRRVRSLGEATVSVTQGWHVCSRRRYVPAAQKLKF